MWPAPHSFLHLNYSFLVVQAKLLSMKTFVSPAKITASGFIYLFIYLLISVFNQQQPNGKK